jgi:DNA-binding NarL/FixJ family response regulator
MGRPRVLLADDHTVLREGVARLLEGAFDIVGSVSNGRELVAEARRLRPDAVVIDVGMPLLNGIEAAAEIRNSVPSAKIVFLSQHSVKEYVRAALRLGASAYVLKNAAAAELVTGISEALGGRLFLSSELRQRFGDADPLAQSKQGGMFVNSLTKRQREVLQLIAEGKTAKEMAYILNISVKTVEFHKAAIMDELALRTTAELTRYAIEQGVLPT